MIDPNNPPLEPGDEEDIPDDSRALLTAEQPPPWGDGDEHVTMSEMSIADMMKVAKEKSIRTAKVTPPPRQERSSVSRTLQSWLPRHRQREQLFHRVLSVCVVYSIGQFLFAVVALAIGGVVPLSENWLAGAGSKELVDLGAKSALLVHTNGEIWRLFSSAVMFGGVFEAIVLLVIQVVYGAWVLEERWGGWKTAFFYLCCALSSNIGSCLWAPSKITVGASAAFLGLVGARVADIFCIYGEPVIEADPRRAWDRVRGLVECLVVALVLFAFGDGVFAPTTPVNTATQAVGLVSGLILGLAVFAFNTRHMVKRIVISGGAALGFLIGVIVVFVQFFSAACVGCV